MIWVVGDKPAIDGKITADGVAPVLLGATIQLRTAIANLIGEKAMTVATDGSFTHYVADAFTSRSWGGAVYVAALQDSLVIRTLNGGCTSSATSTLVNAGTALLTDSGFAKIESEWVKYTFSGSTLTFVERGLFGTTPAAHADLVPVYFASAKETCTPYYPFTIRDAIDLSLET